VCCLQTGERGQPAESREIITDLLLLHYSVSVTSRVLLSKTLSLHCHFISSCPSSFLFSSLAFLFISSAFFAHFFVHRAVTVSAPTSRPAGLNQFHDPEVASRHKRRGADWLLWWGETSSQHCSLWLIVLSPDESECDRVSERDRPGLTPNLTTRDLCRSRRWAKGNENFVYSFIPVGLQELFYTP
jgi:hypothetical protein